MDFVIDGIPLLLRLAGAGAVHPLDAGPPPARPHPAGAAAAGRRAGAG
ncbi:hypothetical protein AB0F13_06000 [Streptomyces sp. NPDC026206]